jgi:hypothetical protein
MLGWRSSIWPKGSYAWDHTECWINGDTSFSGSMDGDCTFRLGNKRLRIKKGTSGEEATEMVVRFITTTQREQKLSCL